jgi:ankyrin repeat protein
MQDNKEIAIQIKKAFRADNTEEFEKLLVEHPLFLQDQEIVGDWMRECAMDGKFEILKTLVKLGADVNTSADQNSEENSFSEPEGPILSAASFGHLEIVKWLLDKGAKFNFIVNGMPRCLPLIHACTEGHFDIVKLLVKHGADVHSVWNGLNAAKQAERFGHPDIRDYLLSQPKNSKIEYVNLAAKKSPEKKPEAAPPKSKQAKKKQAVAPKNVKPAKKAKKAAPKKAPTKKAAKPAKKKK